MIVSKKRNFILRCISISDGQAIGIKLASHIDKVVNSMKEGLVKLNLLMGDKIIAFDNKKIQVENSTPNLIHALIQMACQLTYVYQEKAGAFGVFGRQM